MDVPLNAHQPERDYIMRRTNATAHATRVGTGSMTSAVERSRGWDGADRGQAVGDEGALAERDETVDEQSTDSFPASDPPSLGALRI